LEIDHSSLGRYVRSVCCKPFILLYRGDFSSLKFLEYTDQQFCAPHGTQCVKANCGEPAWQIGCLLGQNVPGIRAFVHLMDGDPSLTVIVKVNPKQRHGAAVTREQ
jgi:hypothetical protein